MTTSRYDAALKSAARQFVFDEQKFGTQSPQAARSFEKLAALSRTNPAALAELRPWHCSGCGASFNVRGPATRCPRCNSQDIALDE